MVLLFITLAFINLSTAQAASDNSLLKVNYGTDGLITGGAILGWGLTNLLPVDTQNKWDKELLTIDESVKQNFSPTAAKYSDISLITTISMPLLILTSQGLNERYSQNALLYGQAVGINLLLNNIVKHAIQRPRPYVYNSDIKVQEYASTQGNDSRLSFYSGHASTAFTGAVAGSYLFAVAESNHKLSALVWGTQLAFASATANWRIKAGKHYYSDVLVGVIMGSLCGVAIPLLHQDQTTRYQPTAIEWLAMASGISTGIILSQLLPFEKALAEQDVVNKQHPSEALLTLNVVPMVVSHGGGLMLVGEF